MSQKYVGDPYARNGGGSALIIGAVFVIGYVFVWQLTKGADPFSTYAWYLGIVFYTAEVLAALTAVIYLIRKRWPMAFEKPPETLEGTAIYGALNAVGGVVASVVGYLLDDGVTAAIAFWPGVFAACALQHAGYWMWHQVNYWRRLWSTKAD